MCLYYFKSIFILKLLIVYIFSDVFNRPLMVHTIERANKDFGGNLEMDSFNLETEFIEKTGENELSFVRTWLRSSIPQICTFGKLSL